MDKTVAEQVEEIILKHYGGSLSDFEDNWKSKTGLSKEDIMKEAGIEFIEDASYTEYDSYGNTFTDYKIIFQHIESGQYIALIGNYQSYNGTEWEGFINIEKKEKVIKVWEKVN